MQVGNKLEFAFFARICYAMSVRCKIISYRLVLHESLAGWLGGIMKHKIRNAAGGMKKKRNA